MKKLKVNDEVIVTTGKNAGKTGKVLSINSKTSKVVVEGVNEVKRSIKPSQQNPEGGFATKNLPIHASNVALVDSKTKKPTRVGFEVKDGKKVRVARKSGSVI